MIWILGALIAFVLLVVLAAASGVIVGELAFEAWDRWRSRS